MNILTECVEIILQVEAGRYEVARIGGCTTS